MNERTIALSLLTPPVSVALKPAITQSRGYYQPVSNAANATLQTFNYRLLLTAIQQLMTQWSEPAKFSLAGKKKQNYWIRKMLLQ